MTEQSVKRKNTAKRMDFAPRKGGAKVSGGSKVSKVRVSGAKTAKTEVEGARDDSNAVKVKRAVSPQNGGKTAPRASKTAPNANSTAVKVNFHKKSAPKKIVVFEQETTIGELAKLAEDFETETDTEELLREMVEEPSREELLESFADEGEFSEEPLEEFSEEPAEEELLEAADGADENLEDVFEELEAERSPETRALFDDYQNPLDRDFVAEPEPLKTEMFEEPVETTVFEETKISDGKVEETTRLEAIRPFPGSPFLASVQVEKRPLSNGLPRVDERQAESVSDNRTTKAADKPQNKKSQPTTQIVASGKKSGSLGLILAILGTVLAGGAVGALIYFLFFQD